MSDNWILEKEIILDVLGENFLVKIFFGWKFLGWKFFGWNFFCVKSFLFENLLGKNFFWVKFFLGWKNLGWQFFWWTFFWWIFFVAIANLVHLPYHQSFWLSPKLSSMCSIVSGVFLTSRMSSDLDFSCAGCLQLAPSSSVHSPQMSHKSTLRMRTNPCQVYSTNLILSVHRPQILPPPTTCPVEPTQIVGPPISHTHISMLCIEILLSISNDVYPQMRKALGDKKSDQLCRGY